MKTLRIGSQAGDRVCRRAEGRAKRLTLLPALPLVLLVASRAVAEDSSAERNHALEAMRTLEGQVAYEQTRLWSFIRDYTVLDDLAARIEGRFPHFNPAKADTLDPLAAVDYLLSLPDPIPAEQTEARTRVLAAAGEQARNYELLKRDLPAIRQRIGELQEVIRALREQVPPAQGPVRVDVAGPGAEAAHAPAPLEATSSTVGEPVMLDAPTTAERLASAIRSYRRKWFDDAYRAFDNLLQVEPELAGAYYGRGSVEAMRGDASRDIGGDMGAARMHWEKALGDFATALSLDPDSFDAANVRYSRGLVYLSLGLEDLAIRDLQQAAHQRHLQSAQVLHREALKHEKEGVAHYMTNRFEQAAVCFERSVGIDPSYVDPWFNYGLMLEKQALILDEQTGQRHGYHRNAIRLYTIFLDWIADNATHPGWLHAEPLYSVDDESELPDPARLDGGRAAVGEANFRIGFNHHSLKELDMALRYYSRAIEYERIATPENLARDYYHRARAYYELEQKDRALADLRKAASLGDTVSREMVRKLEEGKSAGTW